MYLPKKGYAYNLQEDDYHDVYDVWWSYCIYRIRGRKEWEYNSLLTLPVKMELTWERVECSSSRSCLGKSARIALQRVISSNSNKRKAIWKAISFVSSLHWTNKAETRRIIHTVTNLYGYEYHVDEEDRRKHQNDHSLQQKIAEEASILSFEHP